MDFTLEEESSSKSFSEDNYNTDYSFNSSSNSDEYDDYGEREPEPCFHETYHSSSNDTSLLESDQENTSNNTYSSHVEFNVDSITEENEEESIEMLEENNNDPNNNMENENNDTQEFIAITQPIAISPQPGCSKDADIECNSNDLDIIYTAQRIMIQISRITHESIVTALKKAQTEGDTKQISLHDLLPVSQVKSNHPDLKYLKVRKIDKPNGSMLDSSSSMKAESFNKKVFVDLTTITDDSVINNKPAVILNETTGNNCDQIFPLRSRTPIINCSLDSSIESASTSNDNHSIKSKVFNIAHDKPLVKLPEPESHNRKVYVSEIQTNLNSNPLPNIIIMNKSNESTKENKDKPISTSTNRKHHVNNSFVYEYQTSKLARPIKVTPHSNMPATITSNDYKRKHVNTAISVPLPRRIINVQKPSTVRVPQVGPIQQGAKVLNHLIGIFDLRMPTPQLTPALSRRVQDFTPPIQLQKTSDYHDLMQAGPSGLDVESTGNISSEIYNKLRAMFPNLNRDYIKKFCPSKLEMDRDVQLSNIVDRILMEEPLWEYDIEVEQMVHDAGIDNINNMPNVEETCEYLAGIFPDADPHYLRQKAIIFKDENEVKTFVDQQLQNRNYPTREQYLAKLKITQEQERYTTNFVVADFIKIFPDPFSHFENPNRICKYNVICSEFLKTMFNRIRVHTISSVYAESKYNMSLAAKRLKLCNEEMKSRRSSREIPTADIPILQEIAFIRHQNEISRYIEETQLKERIEMQKLKNEGKLLVCQCCYDNECMPSKCSTCENGHNFCNSCIITGTNSKLGDGEAHVPCFMACGSEFSLSTLQKILLPTKFSILLKKRQAAEVMAAGLEGLVSCPFCHFASIPAEGDKVFKCLNPECMKESCIKCKEPNHVPLRCDEVSKADEARKYIEEKMTQAVARTCYKCKRSFFKEEGCNKITCPCGAIMCYLCDKPITDYSHFAGQGSDDNNKCPLWTDNKRVNAEVVRIVAENARHKLLREDPTLIINTNELAPGVPPPTSGPHNQIYGAQNVAVQLAARVMKENRR